MTDFSLEKAAMARGCAAVCGCDEAGAGPLMGPVYLSLIRSGGDPAGGRLHPRP